MAPESPDTLAPGTRLAHFEIRRLLGSGAMGSVYEAHDTSLDRPVAIKVVHASLAGEEGVAERFTLEPRAAARVVHDNLTHVYFVGTTGPEAGGAARPASGTRGPSPTGAGRPFYVMELVPGRTLDDVVASDGPLPLDRAIDVLVQAAQGLLAAHAAGLVHRDVKPSNLLLTPTGRVKVTDFGLAKSVRGDSGSTQHGSLVGTPDYMSPEQCRGRDVDARTDVYLLGLTAFFLLTGSRPWKSDALGEVLNAQMNSPLRSVRDERPDLSPSIDRVLARLCAKDPAERPATMAEAIALLETLRPRPLVLAPLAARAAAILVDMAVFGILVAAAENGVHVATEALGWSEASGILVDVLAYALFAAVTLGAEAKWGTTLGKRLLHLEVRADDGGRARLHALALRFLIRFPKYPLALLVGPFLSGVARMASSLVQLAAILAGVIVGLANGGKTLSDVWTKTRVVYRSRG